MRSFLRARLGLAGGREVPLWAVALYVGAVLALFVKAFASL